MPPNPPRNGPSLPRATLSTLRRVIVWILMERTTSLELGSWRTLVVLVGLRRIRSGSCLVVLVVPGKLLFLFFLRRLPRLRHEKGREHATAEQMRVCQQ